MSKIKRGLALLLCLAIVLPGYIPQTFAANGETALDALGFDTSVAPEGFDEHSTENPYGKSTVVMNPVSELYMVGLSKTMNSLPLGATKGTGQREIKEPEQTLQGTLYGDSVYGKGNAAEVLAKKEQVTIASGSSRRLGTYENYKELTNQLAQLQNMETTASLDSGKWNIALSSVVEGNFDGNKEGKKEQSVMIYTSALNKNGGLFLRTGDIDKANGYGAERTLIDKSKDIGNPSAKIGDATVEDFKSAPYLMQNYMQVQTGDFNGDGRDEIAVYIPEYQNSRIEVYSLRVTENMAKDAYLNPDQWQCSWTYNLREGNYVSNMVSLTAGDFNRDGVDDLAGTWGYYYGPEDNNKSRAVVLFGAKSNMLEKSQEFPLESGSSGVIRGAFAYGDLMSADSDSLILGGQLESDIQNGNTNTRFVAVYNWNGSAFEQTMSKNFNLFEQDKDGNWIYPSMNRSEKKLYSSPLCVSNIDVVEKGPGENNSLYLDSLIFDYGDDGISLTAPMDMGKERQQNTNALVDYVEYGATAGDVLGLGAESLVTMVQTFSGVQDVTGKESKNVTGEYWAAVRKYYYKNWWDKLWGRKTWYTTYEKRTYTGTVVIEETLSQYQTGKAFLSCVNMDGSAGITMQETEFMNSFCMPNTDDDTTFINYQNKHSFTYSDPQVLAVLASPPYFKDLLRDDLSGSYGESSTSYSKTEGSGSGVTASATIEAGVYVGFEQDVKVFGVTVASFESETEIKAGFTYEFEKAANLEQTVTYSTTVGQDSVAFYSIPLEIYEYEASVPKEGGGYEKQTMAIHVPHEASVKMLSLDDYEDIASDYNVLPQISDNVLTHTIGDPKTYPSSAKQFQHTIEYNGTPAGVGFSDAGASISQEIAMTEEKSNSYNFSAGISTKVGGGAGGAKVGIIAGVEAGAGFTNISTSGSSFSGEIYSMPLEAKPYGYGYNWKIFSYEYTGGSLRFPVVSYLVSDITAPPTLPDEFAQNVSATTSDSVTLEWSSNKAVSAYKLYRYYNFPEGSGTQEIATVAFAAGKPVKNDDGTTTYHFSYTDENLSPDTEYSYQISATRAAVPTNSILSAVLKARTKPEDGYPDITLTGDGYANGILPIYPDATAAITANVSLPAGDTGEYKTLAYQWQMNRNGKWTDMKGETSATLSFEKSGSAAGGQYRCRVNALYYSKDHGKEYPITAYSESFTAEFGKRKAKVKDNSFVVTKFKNESGNGVEIKASIEAESEGVLTIPTGTVTFDIIGDSYNASHTVDLKKAGSERHADAEWTVNSLPDGLYQIKVSYSGDLNFKDIVDAESKDILIGNAAGYVLELTANDSDVPTTTFTYGDTINAKVYKLTPGAGQDVTRTELTDVVIKYRLGDLITGTNFDSGSMTPNVGTHSLKAVFTDGRFMMLDRSIVINKRPITVTAKSLIGGHGDSAPTANDFLALANGSTLAGSNQDVVDVLKLTFEATNSADGVVTLSETTLPGRYTIMPKASDDTDAAVYANYDVTFIPGAYTIAGKKHTVTYTVQDIDNVSPGTVSLNTTEKNNEDTYTASTDLIFIASPYQGYSVLRWEAKYGGNGDFVTVQTDGTSYNYTMKDEALEIRVIMKKTDPKLKTSVIPAGSGTVSPNYTTSAIVQPNVEKTFTATPNEGYHFTGWTTVSNGKTATHAGQQQDDDTNVLDFTMGAYDTTIYAGFARDSYTLHLDGALQATYTHVVNSENKTETVYDGALIAGDTEVTVKPKAGYSVPADAEWYKNDMVMDGETGSASVTFNITEETTIRTAEQNDVLSVSAEAENGMVEIWVDDVKQDESSVSDILGGTKVVFRAVADHGYKFSGWVVNDAPSAETDTDLVVPALSETLHVKAEFVSDTEYEMNIALGGNEKAAVSYTQKDKYGRTVVEDADYTGSITTYEGDEVTVYVTPELEQMVQKWVVNDVPEVSAAKSKAFVVDGDMDILIDIVTASKYNVQFAAGADGTISATAEGQDITTDSYVDGGSEIEFTALPAAGYMVGSWTVNGEQVKTKNGNLHLEETLLIDGLTENLDVTVNFTEVVSHNVTVTGDETHLTITKSVSPDYYNDDEMVRDGAAYILTVTPDAGYAVDLVHDAANGDVTDGENGTKILTILSVEDDVAIEVDALSKTASLESLSLENVTLTPAFDAGVFEYTAKVANSVSKVNVSAAAKENGTVSGTGEKALSTGRNRLTVTVTAEDGVTEQDYVIIVTRENAAGGGGGGGGGGDDIVDPGDKEVPPLSEWLNIKEHYAYMLGYSDGTVRPNANITREETAAIFFRLLTEESRESLLTKENSFTDVMTGRWSNTSISTLTKPGIITGYTDGTFRPGNYITRAEFATIAIKFNDSIIATGNSFTDLSGHWAAKSIDRAEALGWIAGYKDGTFRPNEYITRAEAATIINRILNRSVESTEDLLDEMATFQDNADPSKWYYFTMQEAANSHDYERKVENELAEKWTAIIENPDWTKYNG